LAAPAGIATTVNGATQITVNWTQDNDTGLTGYRLESSLNGTSWSTLAILDPSATGAIDTGLTTATAYHFRLFALSAGGDSAPDGPIVATTS
jgi:titin